MENPFSAKFIRPGAIPFHFGSLESAQAVVDRFEEIGGVAQLVGPHGSGKSSLVHHLLPVMDRRGWRPCLMTLHDGEQRISARDWRHARHAACDTWIIDGWEQLTPRWRGLVRAWRWASARRLLVTTHRKGGFPVLAELTTDARLARDLAQWLCRSGAAGQTGNEIPAPLISDMAIEDAFREAGGNLRETFFSLYDQLERASLDSAAHGETRRPLMGASGALREEAGGGPDEDQTGRQKRT